VAALGRPSHAAEQRQRVLGGAAEIIGRQGYRATTMSQIAESVGLTKPTLYHYFHNKEELLVRLYEDVMNESLANAHRIATDIPDPLEALRALIVYRVRYTCEKQALHKVFFEEEEELPAQLFRSILLKRNEFEGVMQDLVARHLSRTHRTLSTSTTVYVNTCLGAANWVYKWYDQSGPRTPDQLGEDIASLVLMPLTT
jgi:TetR/AcrR family transcriptional regulator, cholesterol catabolism regulator